VGFVCVRVRAFGEEEDDKHFFVYPLTN